MNASNGGAKMKHVVLTGIFFASCFLLVNGELTKDQRKWLEDLEISGVRTTTIRDDDRNKYELLEITTDQEPNEDNIEEGFRIHIVAELKDAKKKMYIVDFTGDRPDDFDVEYTGEDYWSLYMPYGDVVRPKITAYAIQYGFMDGENFIVFAEDYKSVKTVEELTTRTTTPYPGIIRLKHYYMYDDVDLGVTESISRTVRQVKTQAASGSAGKQADAPDQE